MIENEKEDIIYNTYAYMIVSIDCKSIERIGMNEIIFFNINSDDVYKIRHLCRKYMINDEYARLNENCRIYPNDFIKKVFGGLNGKC